MNEYVKDIDMTERFLNGKMAEEEKISFETRLNTDPSLGKLVEDLRLMIEGIKVSAMQTTQEEKSDRLRFVAEIMDLEKDEQLPVPSNVVPPYRNKYVWLAAAALLLFTFSFFFNKTQEPQQLFAANFEPYPNVFEPTVRGGTENKSDARTLAFSAYDRGDYNLAAKLFSDLLNKKEESGILLLAGNANLATDNLNDAQNDFLTLIKDFDELDAQAKWYLALTYLKKGEIGKARLILLELENPTFTYSEKAENVLNGLPNN